MGVLEAYRDGLIPSVMATASFTGLDDITQKTLRWPGFAAQVTLLRDLGLLDEAPLTVERRAVRPKALLDAVLASSTARLPDEADVTLALAQVHLLDSTIIHGEIRDGLDTTT